VKKGENEPRGMRFCTVLGKDLLNKKGVDGNGNREPPTRTRRQVWDEDGGKRIMGKPGRPVFIALLGKRNSPGLGKSGYSERKTDLILERKMA